ncbi:unnamed protein product [Phytophthora fragariaefolia]|uniref:Unnamed protein product n=1 Tax=Phytophthora fragariaefolia TaxID=1490495 RepID=A0A9W6XY38_9STRA|nr:unnamed protein product [Phytophthora fragariaefolia]
MPYAGGTITTSGDITCGGSLKGYLGFGNQSTISTVRVLTEVGIGSTGSYPSQEYLLITGNGSNYLDGSYTRMCSFYGSNVTPAWFRIEVSNGSKTVSTSATWIGNNSDTDLRFGTNNSKYDICLGAPIEDAGASLSNVEIVVIAVATTRTGNNARIEEEHCLYYPKYYNRPPNNWSCEGFHSIIENE